MGTSKGAICSLMARSEHKQRIQIETCTTSSHFPETPPGQLDRRAGIKTQHQSRKPASLMCLVSRTRVGLLNLNLSQETRRDDAKQTEPSLTSERARFHKKPSRLFVRPKENPKAATRAGMSLRIDERREKRSRLRICSEQATRSERSASTHFRPRCCSCSMSS